MMCSLLSNWHAPVYFITRLYVKIRMYTKMVSIVCVCIYVQRHMYFYAFHRFISILYYFSIFDSHALCVHIYIHTRKEQKEKVEREIISNISTHIFEIPYSTYRKSLSKLSQINTFINRQIKYRLNKPPKIENTLWKIIYNKPKKQNCTVYPACYYHHVLIHPMSFPSQHH